MSAANPPSFSTLFESVDPLKNQYIIPVRALEISETSIIRENETKGGPVEGRRVIRVSGRPKGQSVSGPIATFWAFSIDGKDSQGPFELLEEIVSLVEIDDRPWGILIEPIDTIFVSVSIDQ